MRQAAWPVATGNKEVPVTVRKLFPLAAAFGLWAGGPAWAEPKDAPKPMSKADNQKLADAVAAALDPAGPTLPPYAWPTYAPYNNVSRVGYPTAYPYNAFPFIGPFYPFPKVPLGWRSVNLTWEDGHWWYGRTSTPHDYWRVRFW